MRLSKTDRSLSTYLRFVGRDDLRLVAYGRVAQPPNQPDLTKGWTMANSEQFVLGLDLDGTIADFYGRMREVAAEWRGVEVESLTEDVTYGLSEWDLDPYEYERLHRFAVTQRDLFSTLRPLPGAAQSIRRLGTEGIRIRVITHRLFSATFTRLLWCRPSTGWIVMRFPTGTCASCVTSTS